MHPPLLRCSIAVRVARSEAAGKGAWSFAVPEADSGLCPRRHAAANDSGRTKEKETNIRDGHAMLVTQGGYGQGRGAQGI